jgi:two-component system chemotaxis response regulator CheB
MAHCPTPILVVSPAESRGGAFKTYDTLAAGALDVLERPSGKPLRGGWEKRYAAALKGVSRIPVVRRPAGLLERLALGPGALRGNRIEPPPIPRSAELVAIGASTGGPAAIIEIVRALPRDFRLPILVVLQVNDPFPTAFADWFDNQTGRRVKCAEHGESLESLAGRIVLAPRDRHLIVRDGRLALTTDPPRHERRPSVDVLFDSIAQERGAAAAACLLTGVGADGAAGLLAIREAGGLTIAQDARTSLIYGMPRAARLIDAAERELPLQLIGPTLAALAAKDADAHV